MKTLIVGFSYANTFLSKLIKYCTKSKISHCYLRIPIPEYSESVVFHAQLFNTHYQNYAHFTKNSTVVEEITVNLNEDQHRTAELVRILDCGKPYGYGELIGYIWVLIGRKFGKKWKNPLSKSDTYVCVEVVCKSLGMTNYSSLTPQDLYDILKKQ
jgi:hypothetical protein